MGDGLEAPITKSKSMFTSEKDLLQKALSMYSTSVYKSNGGYLGPNATEYVTRQVRNVHTRERMRRRTQLLLPKSVKEIFTPDDITRHLKYRHLVYFGKGERKYYAKPAQVLLDEEETASFDQINLKRAELVEHLRLNNKQVAKLRYGVLGWTPIDFHERRPADAAWFLHTWGVNLNEIKDVDGKYVMTNNTPNMNRYNKLLNLMFEVVSLAVEAVHTQSQGKNVLLRIAGLGMGAWATHLGSQKPRAMKRYDEHLQTLAKKFPYLQIRVPDYPNNKTWRVDPSTATREDWTEVENNHDPFGDAPKSFNPDTTVIEDFPNSELLIVNAWDNGSWIGNGGSRDDTMDGWTVAGGSPTFALSSVGTGRLGHQCVNASYLHNLLFNPQLLQW